MDKLLGNGEVYMKNKENVKYAEETHGLVEKDQFNGLSQSVSLA